MLKHYSCAHITHFQRSYTPYTHKHAFINAYRPFLLFFEIPGVGFVILISEVFISDLVKLVSGVLKKDLVMMDSEVFLIDLVTLVFDVSCAFISMSNKEFYFNVILIIMHDL